jgi:AbrB family looped-hinge helix DNA binding protein
LSGKNQVTIPADVVDRTGLAPGDELRVNVDDEGRIVLQRAATLAERRRAAIEQSAGILTGVYEPGYLEKLRSEWR